MNRSRNDSRRLALGIACMAVLGAVSLANWVERGRFGVPEDGVLWADRVGRVAAERVRPEGPAAKVGVRPGDLLVSIGGSRVHEALDATRILAEVGSWNRTQYVFERGERVHTVTLTVGEIDTRDALGHFLLILGWVYGGIGLLVWLRGRPSAALVRFLAFSAASLALYSLSSTGKLDALDRLVYWLDIWALLLVPPLFLDFCRQVSNREALGDSWVRRAYGLAVAVGVAHHAVAGGWVGASAASTSTAWLLDTAPLVLLVGNLVGAALVLWFGARRTDDPFRRHQSGWLGFGALSAALPFGGLYVLPYAVGLDPGPSQEVSVLSLAALPVTIAVAMLRYRLLDLEFVWRRTVASALAGGLLLGVGSLSLALWGAGLRWLESYGPVVWLGSLAAAALLFFPLRGFILGVLERRAYRGRLGDRRTLASFATELAAETDPPRMVQTVCDRLARTLDVARVAVFTRDLTDGASAGRFRLLGGTGMGESPAAGPYDLGRVADRQVSSGNTVVLPSPGEGPGTADVAELRLWHFVPCALRGDTVAWIAMGSTSRGRLLSREDLALVEALAPPFAIALENARLYASLQARAEEYERLKDYNENIVESLAVGILVLDRTQRVMSWNAQLELATHISRDVATGRPLRDLLPASLVDEIVHCSEDGGSGQVLKFRLSPGDFPREFRPADARQAAERILNLAVAPLIGKDFRTIGRLVILDDVTERVSLEEQMVHADRLSAAGVLAAGVAHEVNTPLAVISSYAQLLAGRFDKGTDEARMLERVTEQTFRASEIVNSLLDFSRTSSPEMGPCDLHRTIRDTLDLIAPQLRRASIAVETDFGCRGEVWGDRGRLQQVFLNLFLNARDAMPGGGTLSVSTRAPSSREHEPVEVRISDDGPGMESAVRRRIFDPFYTTKDAGGGHGLGLAVTYGIVREHSGSISVASAPEEGTTFTLVLPPARQALHA